VHYCIVGDRTIVLEDYCRLAVQAVQHLLAGRRGSHALHIYNINRISILYWTEVRDLKGSKLAIVDSKRAIVKPLLEDRGGLTRTVT
jgi:hypothetical protein